jgi:phage terminase large subunit-like protein
MAKTSGKSRKRTRASKTSGATRKRAAASKTSRKTRGPYRWQSGVSGNPATQFKAGQSGNPKGAPKAARRNLNEAFIADWLKAWSHSGDDVFKRVIAQYPDVFVCATGSLATEARRAKIEQLIDNDPALAARVLAATKDMSSAEAAAARAAAARASHAQAEKGDGETNRLAAYRPYKKQISFHASGTIHDERLLLAGNQLGKTLAGAMEWAMHLTGRYPDWWKGRVFHAPVRMWAAGVTAESTRDNPQRVLVGIPQRKESWGTGTIPKDALKDWTVSSGAARDGLGSVVVRWGGGGDVQQGESVLSFKSYEKGREKWQGETLDGVWFDEEPPLDIYCEGRTRTVARRGIVILTMTPLLGMTVW